MGWGAGDKSDKKNFQQFGENNTEFGNITSMLYSTPHQLNHN
jgi:hypothetical protein